MKTALIIGSTGLIGSDLLKFLLANSDYKKVIAFSKRNIDLKHPKLELQIIDFDKPDTFKNSIKGDDFFCAIGTTIKQAGSKKGFRKVDYDYPKQFASIAATNGIKQFLLISSLGADSTSNNFYLKTKGDIENFLKATTFKTVAIVRPSLLLGDRKEFRLGEKIGGFLMETFSFLFIWKLKSYKPIQSSTVAKALELIANNETSGFKIYGSAEIEKIVNS